MPQVPSHQVVGPRRIGALQEYVVVRILRHLNWAQGANAMGTVPNALEKLLTQALTDVKLRPRQNQVIFGQNGVRDIQPGGFGERQKEHCVLQTVWFQSC
jgi:hypothetical protein